MPTDNSHEDTCIYGKSIRKKPEKITDEKGTDRCGFCHEEWVKPTPKATTKTTGGK